MQCLIEPIEEHFPNQVMVVGLNMFYLLVNGSLGWPLFTIYTALSKSSNKDKNKDKDKKTMIKTNVGPWFTFSPQLLLLAQKYEC